MQERGHLSFQVRQVQHPLKTAYEQNEQQQQDQQSNASAGLDVEAETMTTTGFKVDSWCVQSMLQ